jgi:hypothetical protein
MSSRKSKGHIAFVGDFEYIVTGGEIGRAPLHNAFDENGQRHSRWEGPDRASTYRSIQDHINFAKKDGAKVSVNPKYRSKLQESTMSKLGTLMESIRLEEVRGSKWQSRLGVLASDVIDTIKRRVNRRVKLDADDWRLVMAHPSVGKAARLVSNAIGDLHSAIDRRASQVSDGMRVSPKKR